MATAFDFPSSWNNVNPNVTAAALPAAFQAQAALYQQPAAFAQQRQQNYGNYTQGFNGYGQALAGLGNAYANNYGAYASGLGNVAQAQANALNNQNANNGYTGMAEAARQAAIGNLGSAALGAYGGASNNAMQAWAQNQMAYNKAMSDLGAANQTGLSQLGQSRNNAIGTLGNSYAKAGLGFAVADALGGMNFGGGGGAGGGFSASGPGGEIASGSYSSQDIGAPMSSQRSGALGGMMDRTFAGLDATRGDLNSTDIADRLDRNYAGALQALNDQHGTSRGMPADMMDQALRGLHGLNRMNLDASTSGMTEFYNRGIIPTRDPQQINVTDALSGLTYGYGDSADRIGGVQSQIGSGWGDMQGAFRDSNAAIDRVYDSSIGREIANQNQDPLIKALNDSRASLTQRLINLGAAGYTGDKGTARALKLVEERLRELSADPTSLAYGGVFGDDLGFRDAPLTWEAAASRRLREMGPLKNPLNPLDMMTADELQAVVLGKSPFTKAGRA